MQPNQNHGKRVLITGCSKGIGRATAEELTRRGHEVVATARRLEALADLPVAQRLVLDVTDPESVAAARREVGPIDALVNNAGELFVAPIETVPLHHVEALFRLNVFGTLRLMQAFAPSMRERRSGTIVNISSFVGRFATPLVGVYASTKFAVEALSEAARIELSHFGVRVVIIEPGSISTGAVERSPVYLDESSPYGELAAQLRVFSPTSPQTVAARIADAIEATDPPLRIPVGPDAEAMLAARQRQSDAEFEASLRAGLSLDW